MFPTDRPEQTEATKEACRIPPELAVFAVKNRTPAARLGLLAWFAASRHAALQLHPGSAARGSKATKRKFRLRIVAHQREDGRRVNRRVPGEGGEGSSTPTSAAKMIGYALVGSYGAPTSTAAEPAEMQYA